MSIHALMDSMAIQPPAKTIRASWSISNSYEIGDSWHPCLCTRKFQQSERLEDFSDVGESKPAVVTLGGLMELRHDSSALVDDYLRFINDDWGKYRMEEVVLRMEFR